MNIDLEQIRNLLAVVSSTDITELTIEFGEHRITIKKGGTVQHISADLLAAAAPVAPPKPTQSISFEPKQDVAPAAKEVIPEPPPSASNLVPVTSPMVGTFYRAGSPTSSPFVNVGDHIAVGQTVCIIEAMKLMNDMPSEVSGKIVKVCVDNGTTVEYGQQLFLVDPKG
ncbi:MAG: acetyl-CoA carboxylase biotin carboxyl carrier protein [Cyanobacteria bacterium SZAS-4]|nr:acetyl-CoA carboxylase biotin carboxyl carrier protein [Cyanobacteria bacterium SZAS-4]